MVKHQLVSIIFAYFSKFLVTGFNQVNDDTTCIYGKNVARFAHQAKVIASFL